MNQTLPSLFSDASSESPYIYNTDTVPRGFSKPSVTFRFDKGEIGLSLALLSILTAEQSRRVMFVNYKGSAYITRVDTGGYWLELRERLSGLGGYSSAQLNCKRLVQDALRASGNGPGDIVSFPVAPHPINASELGLDPTVYPYPFYRIIKDQKTLKTK